MADTHLDAGQQALLKKLKGRQAHYQLMERYYDGDAPLPESAEGQSRAYRRFQRKSRLNLAQLSVAAVRERMVIGGFRTGAEDDENGDREARRLWKANHLDYLSSDLHSFFLRFGSAYAIVGYPDSSDFPVVTIEDPRQRLIAGHFVNALEPTGWIGMSVAEIAAASGSSEDEAEAVLDKLQTFEPTGLFARDLADCLRLQLIEQGLFSDDFAILLDNLELLGRGEIKRLARLIDGTAEDVMELLKIIRTLNPKPGEFLGIDHLDMPSPDVIVRRRADGWAVELNRSTLPAVVINEDYAEMLEKRRLDEDAKNYSAGALNNARWLKRAVEQRNSTTLKISAEIIRQQTDFLDKGLDYLKPLSLRDVAQAVGMHESTVSRVTTGLLIATPRGGMPLKSFFSVNIASRDSENDTSAAAVRNMVKRLISQEQPGKPLSDEAISKMISDQGIDLARRTVAKYREMLNIPSSSQRRMQARLANIA